MAEEKKKKNGKTEAEDRGETVKKNTKKKGSDASQKQTEDRGKTSSGTKKKSEIPPPKREEAPPSPQKKKKEKSPSPVIAQLMVVLLGVLSLFIVICYAFRDSVGILGSGIANGLFGLFGLGAFLVPFLLFQLALYWKRDAESGAVKYKYIVAICVLLFTSIIAHAIYCLATAVPKLTFASAFTWSSLKSLFTDGMHYRGGGFLGGFFAVSFICAVGYPGTLIFGIILLLLFVMALFGLTPTECIQRYLFYRQRNQNIRRVQKQEAEKRRAEKEARQREAQREEEERMRREREKQRDAWEKETAARAAYEAERAKEPEQEEAPRKNRAANIDRDIFADDAEFGRAETVTSEEVRRAKAEAKKPVEPKKPEKVRLHEYFPVKEDTAVLSKHVGDEDLFFDDDIKAAETDITPPAKAIGESAGAKRKAPVRDENIIALPPKKSEPADMPAYAPVAQKKEPVTAEEKPKKPFAPKPAAPAPEAESETEEISILPPDPMVEAPDIADDEEDAIPARPEYEFPPIEFLTEAGEKDMNENVSAELRENADRIIQTLESFHVRVKISHVSRGPTVTRYELEPAAGTRVRSITNLLDDIALSLATSGVRSDGIITGKSAIGIEVPNKVTSTVYVRELIDDNRFADAKSRLTTCLGMDVSGAPVYLDIAKMPHLLIAGATGMGKSVCINSLLVSLLYKARPDEVKLILIDPKKVELNIYNGIPHLLVPVVFDPKKAAGSLHWAVTEMERRFELIEAQNTRNIAQYNAAIADDPKKEFLPQIVIIIDELADLMMSAPDDVEASICRLAQKARAAGMHLIIGTQRPSVDVITGLIKANIPSRIAFTVASQIDSRTIIDAQGAEKLIGKGDMLYAPVGASKPIRVQGSFVSEKEIDEIVGFIKAQSMGAAYSDDVMEQINRAAESCGQKKGKGGGAVSVSEGDAEDTDPMLDKAIELAVESGKISTSLIQRRLQLGYGRAAKIIDMMERRGIVSPPEGQKPRAVLITREQYLEMQMNRSGDSSAQSGLDDEAPF